MFASIWYAKKLGRRFVHNARKAKSEKPLLNRFPRAVFLEPYCEDHICKNDKLLTSTCTEAVKYRLWMKLSGPR
ncbi:unnamed protein product [Rangifer tarandus platyrhynchus]|uniref:Uncharacterized protein n=1 Tax=Rangifer tarandus platyrhynchus TaxID=3082113 RepID=A0AC59Z8T2_RANTA